MSIEWRDWCRLCANSNGRGSCVFENSDQLLSEKIFKYLSISIESQDELPQTICELCSQRLNSFDRYADQCLRVQSMYRAMIEQTDPSDTKVGLIREEFLQENEEKHHENDVDSKVNIELMAIDADPFIPSDSSGPIVKKTKSKTSRKRTAKQKHMTAKPRGRKMSRAAQKIKGENERERRTSSRLQGIAQMQRDFAIITNTDVQVKEEYEENEDDEDEDEPSQSSSKKRGRTPKALVGAAKRKAKVPRVVKQKEDETANSKEAVSEEEFNDVKDDNIANESDDNANDNSNEMDNGNGDNDNENDNYNEDDGIKTEEDKETNSQPSIFRWECHVCNQVFRNWNSLSVHCRQDHQVPAQVVCLCAKVLASRASIIKHRLKHTNAYKYRCDKCDKAFHRKSLYDLHVLSHVPKEEQPFVCCKCARRFHCEALLRHHERVHLPREERLVYPCNVCSKKFSSRSNVSAHLKAVHFGERPFVCDQCGHSFTSKGILQEHLTIHSDETPFKCAQCKKSFKTKYRLKIHMDTHRETPYQCPVCPHQLSTRRTLRMHLLVHRDTKAYQCATCGKAFKRSKDLKNHHNLHTGRRPYTCTFCPRTFANGSNCRAHKRKMHPEELRIYEASLAAAENENSGGNEQPQILNSTLVAATNSEHQVSNSVQQSDANSVLHNCPTPDHKPIVIHSNSIAAIPSTEFERHSIFESNGNVNLSMKASSQVPHIPRSSASSVEYPSGSPQEVNDVGRATMVHMVQSAESSSSMMGISSASMARINENNGCRNLHQSSRNNQNLSSSIETDSGNRNMSAINLNASRRNMNSSSDSMLNTSHLASLTPLNLNVSEMHSSRHQHHLNESPTLSEIEESSYMAVSRRPIDNFTNSRSHIPNLNSNIQIHRQQQHQSLTSLSRSLVEREMSASSNLNRMHHGQHPGSSAELQGYTSLNHLYQHHGESMPSAVAAAIAHSGSMGVPAFPGNPYIHHNMGYNRGSTNM